MIMLAIRVEFSMKSALKSRTKECSKWSV